MKQQTQVVIIGAGIAGSSVAYHLTKLGWSDIVVIDQGPLPKTGGSTSHAPGLVFQVSFSRMMSVFAAQTTQIYDSLNPPGDPKLWFGVGGLEIAWTPERLQDLKRKVGAGKAWGIETELIGAAETRALVPLLSERIYGAMYTRHDGFARPWQLAGRMMEEAKTAGVSFHGEVTVKDIRINDGRVRAVKTSEGVINTEHVVCAAGIWGSLVARMAGVTLPLAALRHQYAETAPLAELAGQPPEDFHPVIRHQDRAMYFRQEAQSYIIGSYDHEPMPLEPEDIQSRGDSPVMPSMMPWSRSAFRKGMISAKEILPPLGDVELTNKVNGMFIFTPDGMPVLGEAPNVKGFWSAEAVWITHGGGVGKAVAEWMVEGEQTMDLRAADISRFLPHQLTHSYISKRGMQTYREVYDIVHPRQQLADPRGLRVLPYHQRCEQLGAYFIESSGWERPQWFEANADLLEGSTGHYHTRSGWEAQYWSPIIGAEHRAVRERVGLFDLTPFTKLEVTGPGALNFLQHIAANQMDQPVGSVTYTSMLTPGGGIKCDLTVTRLDGDRFLVVTGSATAEHDKAWLRSHMPDDHSVALADVSNQWCCIGVWGPRARELMRQVTDDDVTDSGFPYLTARTITLGEVPALALRISYAGELGWEIYAKFEFGQKLWDTLMEGGRYQGVIAAGLGAFDSLRLEKGYRLWGADIHTEFNPYEAGIGFAVRLDKGDFIGREALSRARSEGPTRKLCCMTFDDHNVVVMGHEPMYIGGKLAGHVTSANYGYSVGRGIAYGYMSSAHSVQGTKVEIEYFGELHAATVVSEPLWDPAMERLRR